MKRINVHRLVLAAFVGACPVGMEGCHTDGNSSNNAVENLRWDTRQANIADTVKHGRTTRGERSGSSKLSISDVFRMKDIRRVGVTYQAIANYFGVAMETARQAIIERSWIPDPASAVTDLTATLAP